MNVPNVDRPKSVSMAGAQPNHVHHPAMIFRKCVMRANVFHNASRHVVRAKFVMQNVDAVCVIVAGLRSARPISIGVHPPVNVVRKHLLVLRDVHRVRFVGAVGAEQYLVRVRPLVPKDSIAVPAQDTSVRKRPVNLRTRELRLEFEMETTQ